MEREGLRTPPERKECKENDEWVFFMGPGFTLIYLGAFHRDWCEWYMLREGHRMVFCTQEDENYLSLDQDS